MSLLAKKESVAMKRKGEKGKEFAYRLVPPFKKKNFRSTHRATGPAASPRSLCQGEGKASIAPPEGKSRKSVSRFGSTRIDGNPNPTASRQVSEVLRIKGGEGGHRALSREKKGAQSWAQIAPNSTANTFRKRKRKPFGQREILPPMKPEEKGASSATFGGD